MSHLQLRCSRISQLCYPDLPSGEKMSKRRIEKSADRTQAWLKYTVSQDRLPATSMFASIPPLELEQQQLYISDLSSDHLGCLGGLCIYEPPTALIIPQQLSKLPIVCISNPTSPHSLLQAISLGIDLITTAPRYCRFRTRHRVHLFISSAAGPILWRQPCLSANEAVSGHRPLLSQTRHIYVSTEPGPGP